MFVFNFYFKFFLFSCLCILLFKILFIIIILVFFFYRDKFYCLHFTVEEQRLRKPQRQGHAARRGQIVFKPKSIRPQGCVGANEPSSFRRGLGGGGESGFTGGAGKGAGGVLTGTREDFQGIRRPRCGCGGLVSVPSLDRSVTRGEVRADLPNPSSLVVVRSLEDVMFSFIGFLGNSHYQFLWKKKNLKKKKGCFLSSVIPDVVEQSETHQQARESQCSSCCPLLS